ncbi:MAG: hypothetical protein J6Y93_02185, partial [Treponema sp.]|nr:hypothetical protein [Treponema sp.]
FDKAGSYINQALRYHSNDAAVHFLAAYLSAKENKIDEAEKRLRSAMQIKGDYIQAYVFLANILFEKQRYPEVIDIADYLIKKDRNLSSAWYFKGLAQYRNSETALAIETWSTGLTIAPQDEIMRAALELAVNQTLPVEDERRSEWAEFHIHKAREYSKMYQGAQARYEYQRALRLDPSNIQARYEFAGILSKLRLNELYLNQLKFIKSQTDTLDEKNLSADEAARKRSVEDTIEAYEALMKYSINEKWNIDPFYLDKNRWNIGIYCKKSSVRLLHADSGEITARMIADIFSGVATTSVSVRNSSVEGYGEAFRLARESKLDYFIIMDFEETEREVSLEAVMYSGRTGTETKRISVFRTGNDRYAGVLRSFRKTVLDVLSVRGKVLKRSGNEVLVDLGKSEGITAGTVLDLVKKGSIRTADKGPGIIFDSKNSLGTIKIEQVGEEISSGRLTQNGFYDRVNIGDEVVIKSVPKAEDAQGQALISDTNPAADENGNTLDSVSMAARELGLVRTPAVIDIIRSIQ